LAAFPWESRLSAVTALIDPNSRAGARALDRLRHDIVAWLTTVRPDGLPQTSVVWFLWREEEILIYSRPHTPKLRNIAQSQGVSFALNSDQQGDNMLTMSGTARIDSSLPPAQQIEAYLDKYRNGVRGLGMTPETFGNAYSVPIVITPVLVRYW